MLLRSWVGRAERSTFNRQAALQPAMGSAPVRICSCFRETGGSSLMPRNCGGEVMLQDLQAYLKRLRLIAPRAAGRRTVCQKFGRERVLGCDELPRASGTASRRLRETSHDASPMEHETSTKPPQHLCSRTQKRRSIQGTASDVCGLRYDVPDRDALSSSRS